MQFVLGLVVLVLSILAGSSPQQFHQHQERSAGQRLWWSQYLQPQITTEARGLIYSNPVDIDAGNTPFFRYSKPIHIRPTVIYSHNDEEESYRQKLLDRKQYHHSDQQNVIDDQLKRQYLFLIEQLLSGRRRLIIPVMAGHSAARPTTITIPSQMAMPRIKNYGPVRDLLMPANQEENARFFYLDGNNFLSKTVTISVTSTCTSISFVSCIPLTSLDPSDPPVNCRRRRRFAEIDHIDHSTDHQGDSQQFPVNPTAVQTVMPTVETMLPRDSIPTSSLEMTSSKEEENNNDESSHHIIGRDEQLRNGRFLKFNFQSFLTYTTITILKSIITSTLTQTYVPAAALACLPAGYSICPI